MSEVEQTLRPAEWEKDGVAVDDEGNIVMRSPAGYLASADGCYRMETTRAEWYMAKAEHQRLQWDNEALLAKVAGRDPDRRLTEFRKELLDRAKQADIDAGQSTGPGKNSLLGHSQAYTAALTLFDRLFDICEERRGW